MDKATLEIINNVPYAVLSDGRKIKYADIMAYNNPGMQYDDVTLDVIVATPASAEAGMMPGGEVAPDTFGDTTSRMASPYFEAAADLASTAGRRPTYFQNPLMQGLERTGQYIGDMGLTGVNAALGGVYGGAGLLGEAFGGDTSNERRLARDLAAMFDVAGPAPEGRALGLLTDAALAGRAAPSRAEFLAGESGAMPVPDSAAFRDWFGGSKAVDQAGNPRLMVHASPNSDISEFRKADGGVWFAPADNTSEADIIASDTGRGTLPNIDPDNYPDVGIGATFYPSYLSIRNPITEANGDLLADLWSGDKTVSDLSSLGYDGAIWPDGVAVAFDPAQAKSPFNRGTWSRTDPRLLYGLGGLGLLSLPEEEQY